MAIVSYTVYDMKIIHIWGIPIRVLFSRSVYRVSCILHFHSKLFVQLLCSLLDSDIFHTYQFWLRIKCHIKCSQISFYFSYSSISLSKRIDVSFLFFEYYCVTKIRLKTSNGNQMRSFNEQKSLAMYQSLQIQSFPCVKVLFLLILHLKK